MLVNEELSINSKHLQIIKYCKNATRRSDLFNIFGEKDICYLFDRKVLIVNEDIWKLSNLVVCEIETCTTCNYKCIYCPNIYAKRMDQVMELDLFKRIIEKVMEHRTFQIITFNLYNEPLLDPFLIDRLKILSHTTLKFVLNTNGSKLNSEKIAMIKKIKIPHEIYFNIPSLDAQKYFNMTKGNLNVVLNNLDECINAGFKVTIAINGLPKNQMDDFNTISQKYATSRNVSVVKWETTDRAGNLNNKFNQNIDIKSRLSGCKQFINYLQIDVNGNIILCCNDYHKKYSFGNILEHSIQQIICSYKYTEYKKLIFGNIISDEKILCNKCNEMLKNNIFSRLLK